MQLFEKKKNLQNVFFFWGYTEWNTWILKLLLCETSDDTLLPSRIKLNQDFDFSIEEYYTSFFKYFNINLRIKSRIFCLQPLQWTLKLWDTENNKTYTEAFFLI